MSQSQGAREKHGGLFVALFGEKKADGVLGESVLGVQMKASAVLALGLVEIAVDGVLNPQIVVVVGVLGVEFNGL